jgi:hypothetical protein
VAEAGDVEGWRLLREMCGDIVELRKGDHSAERLQIDRERLKLETEKSEKQVSEKVARLVEQYKASGQRLSQEERACRLREIFGRPSGRKEKGGLSESPAAEDRAPNFLPPETAAATTTGNSTQ